MDDLKSIKFPTYVNTSERSITVLGMIKEGKENVPELYIDGKGYIDEKT